VTERTAARHIDVVDGLRGLAILLVMAFHYWQLSFWALRMPGVDLEFVQFAGYLGVELFFFISAFCLFSPHAKAMFGRGAVPTLRHYLDRRAIKILPSYLLVLLLLGVFLPGLYPIGTGAGGVPMDVALHLTFLHNLQLSSRGSFDGVLWSLAVEVQFYCVFPMLARAFRRRPWWTAAAMVAVAVGFRAWARRGPLDGFANVDSQLPAFLDLFALGMLTAYLLTWIAERPAAAQRLRAVFTVGAVAAFGALLTLFHWTNDIRYGGPVELWQSVNRQYVGAVLLCLTLGSAFAVPLWRRLVANRVLVFLSTISYNLYLWHQVIGRLIRDRGWWPASTPVPTDDPTWRWSYTMVSVAASVLVATAITYGVERPLLRRGVRGATASVLGWFETYRPGSGTGHLADRGGPRVQAALGRRQVSVRENHAVGDDAAPAG